MAEVYEVFMFGIHVVKSRTRIVDREIVKWVWLHFEYTWFELPMKGLLLKIGAGFFKENMRA